MGEHLPKKILKGQKGFATGYLLIIIAAILALVSSLLISSLAENKQAIIHRENISAYYTAESGAQIAHLALKEYIQAINEEVVESYTWDNIKHHKDYLQFLKHGSLGTSRQGNEVTFHLNLAKDADYYLAYSEQAIINDLGDNSSLQATITLSMPSAGYLGEVDGGECLLFPLDFKIRSIGEQSGAIPGKYTISGNGTAFIKFCPGSFARFALFTDVHRIPPPLNYNVWFNEFTTYDGPVYSNDSLYFQRVPVFYDRVYSASKTAAFNNNSDCSANNIKHMDADSNPPYDMPIFHKGFTRGVASESLPMQLTELRELTLQEHFTNPPYSSIYFFPTDKNGKLSGGLFFSYPTSIELISQGNKQLVRTVVANSKRLDFIFDYANKTTEVYDRDLKRTLASYNSLPNGTIFVNNDIPSLKGTVQKDARLTIGSLYNIKITGHIKYEEDPREYPQAKNILGILAENGHIIVPNNGAPNDLVIMASLMAPRGAFQIENILTVRGDRGVLTLLGGVISKFYGPLAMATSCNDVSLRDGYGRHIIYDQRMKDINKMPLGFPKTVSLQYSSQRDDGTDTFDLVIWKEEKNY